MMKFATLLQLFIFLPLAVFSQEKCGDIFGAVDLFSLSTPHVTAIASEVSLGGGLIFKFIKTDAPNVITSITRPDPHGDIGLPSKLLGRAGPYWGFDSYVQSGQKIFTQGNVPFLNKKIPEFNTSVTYASRIPFIFFEVPDRIIGDFQFVDLHGGGKITVAIKGGIRMHDMDYHVVSHLIIPTSFHEVAFLKSKIISEFYKYIIDKESATTVVFEIVEKVLKSRAIDIDYTGNILVYLDQHGQTRESFINYLSVNSTPVFTHYVRPSYAPAEYLLFALLRFGEPYGADKKQEIISLVRKFLYNAKNNAYIKKPNLPVTEAALAKLVYDRYLFILENSGP